jgi:hypothetical protein
MHVFDDRFRSPNEYGFIPVDGEITGPLNILSCDGLHGSAVEVAEPHPLTAKTAAEAKRNGKTRLTHLPSSVA